MVETKPNNPLQTENASKQSDEEKDSHSSRSWEADVSPTEDPEKQTARGLGRNADFINTPITSGTDVDESNVVCPEDDESDHSQDGRLSHVVSRVLSRTSIRSDPGPPPDGGTKAWLAVACGHLVIMNTWGVINSFGIFQSYYATFLGHPPSDISWIGSIQVFLLFFIGTLTGRLTDAGYFRHVYFSGVAFQALGIFTTANATRYWQFFLSQGICVGLGNGCLFCPTMTLISTYFARRRNFAIGIVACGSGTGGLIFPSMARQLLPSAGFPWTMRAIGFVQFTGFAIASLYLRPRIPPRKAGAWVEWAAFKELEYTFYAIGSFGYFIGLYFAFYYLVSFSRDILHMPYTESLNLLLVLNGLGLIGRLGPNLLADLFGPLNVFAPAGFVAGVCVLGWIGVTSAAGLYAWSVFYGIAGGGIQSLFPAGLSSLTADLRKAGVRMGMVFTIISFAVLTGPPIAGALITAAGGRYFGAQLFCALSLLVGTVFLVAARVVKGKKLGGGWTVKV